MPCDMSKYPADWPQRRARILLRAGNRCERCGVDNGAIGYREPDGTFRRIDICEQGDTRKYIRIVLTIAHLVEDGPLDCPDEDMQALCQRCHNVLDTPMRVRHRRERRHAGQCALVLED